MFYQQLLTGPKPYFVAVGPICSLEHRHPELELNYCISGSYQARIDNKLYTINQGDIVLIGSMVSHEVFSCGEEYRAVAIEVGPVLLREYFREFSNIYFLSPVYSPDNRCENVRAFVGQMEPILTQLVQDYLRGNTSAELGVMGGLFRMCACIMEEIRRGWNVEKKQAEAFRAMENIDKALEIIYNRYSERITVEEVASLTGYQKSNFCRVFKSVVGDSFHQVLNRHRVEIAQALLRETNYSVEEIAFSVGFLDSKSLCRVFKKLQGMSPGQYRSAMANSTGMPGISGGTEMA